MIILFPSTNERVLIFIEVHWNAFQCMSERSEKSKKYILSKNLWRGKLIESMKISLQSPPTEA